MENAKRKRLTVSVSPEKKMTKQDWINFFKNAVIFSAPALMAYFAQLQMGVSPREALPVAGLIFYGLMADLFKKWSKKKYYN